MTNDALIRLLMSSLCSCINHLDAGLLGYLDWHIDGVLGTHCLGELLALLPGHVDREVLAPLVRHLLALGPWDLLLHLLGYLLTVLLRNLKHTLVYCFAFMILSLTSRLQLVLF